MGLMDTPSAVWSFETFLEGSGVHWLGALSAPAEVAIVGFTDCLHAV